MNFFAWVFSSYQHIKDYFLFRCTLFFLGLIVKNFLLCLWFFFSQEFPRKYDVFSLFSYFIIVSLIIIQIISLRQVSMVSVVCSTLPRTINKGSQPRVPYDPMITKDLL